MNIDELRRELEGKTEFGIEVNFTDEQADLGTCATTMARLSTLMIALDKEDSPTGRRRYEWVIRSVGFIRRKDGAQLWLEVRAEPIKKRSKAKVPK